MSSGGLLSLTYSKPVKSPLLVLLAALLLSGCASAPKYLERTSEALSRSVYATGDSLVLGRVELAKAYNDAAEKLVPPPKERIQIKSLHNGTSSVVTLPESYTGSIKVGVGSKDYEKMVKSQEENKTLTSHLQLVEQERQKQDEIHNQLIKDYESARLTIANQSTIIAKKELALWAHRAVILLILALIGLGIYLKALVPVRIW